jgi:hypothetical protein
MQVEYTFPSSPLVPDDVQTALVGDISSALNSLVTVDDQFIINDTIWLKKGM